MEAIEYPVRVLRRILPGLDQITGLRSLQNVLESRDVKRLDEFTLAAGEAEADWEATHGGDGSPPGHPRRDRPVPPVYGACTGGEGQPD